MRELKTSLQQFGKFVLKAQIVSQKAAPYFVCSIFVTDESAELPAEPVIGGTPPVRPPVPARA